ncbi:uncharacterized protein LOC124154112 [Ischnura elegans]|uniref:uncharacterized protein LOC124154112 n=1 Tax=Ischnura elegans TaxID=197161 RepID=UPI001ED8B3BB|nr:uncharacterized protein LOC124154112 [Ischnura elegans]
MGFYRIALLCCSFLAPFIVSGEYVPVFLLDSTESTSTGAGVPALSKLSGDVFREQLLRLIDKSEGSRPPVILVFAEESLSVEDFSWANIGDYGLYPRLVNITKSSNSVFLPAVHQPLRALEGLVESGFKWKKYTPTQFLMTIATGGDKLIPKITQDTKGVVVYVDMEDANPSEDRPDMLRRHDTFIVDAFEKLKNDRDVVVIYTANHSSWYDTESEDVESSSFDSENDEYVREIRSSSRHLLAEPNLKAENKTYAFYNANNTIIVYSKSHPVYYNKSGADPIKLDEIIDIPLISNPPKDPLKQSMHIKFKTSQGRLILRFYFEQSKWKYWNLTSVVSEFGGNLEPNYTLIPSKHIEAPVGFSYHCSQTIDFVGPDGIRVSFDGLQLQSFLKGDKVAFGDGYDCVYFFTAAIWSGLFVTFLLGLILTWGLSMIMSIRTMDRFDDPKGKTITIGAAE